MMPAVYQYDFMIRAVDQPNAVDVVALQVHEGEPFLRLWLARLVTVLVFAMHFHPEGALLVGPDGVAAHVDHGLGKHPPDLEVAFLLGGTGGNGQRQTDDLHDVGGLGDQLRLQLAELQSPERIAQAARDRLGMIAPNTVTFLEPSPTDDSAAQYVEPSEGTSGSRR